MSVPCHVHEKYQPWCLLCLGASTKKLREEQEQEEADG